MKLNKNRLIEAFSRLIIFSAIVHLFVLGFYTVLNLDITRINYFSILDLDLFFPGINKSLGAQIFSIIVVVVIYLIFYFIPKSSKTGKGR